MSRNLLYKVKKIPKALRIELPPNKNELLAKIAATKGLRPTTLARLWILEKLEEYERAGEAGA